MKRNMECRRGTRELRPTPERERERERQMEMKRESGQREGRGEDGVTGRETERERGNE